MDIMIDNIISYIREIYNKPDGIIPLHEPVFIGNEVAYVNNTISTTYVSSVGKYVDLFETKIADYTRAGYAVATVNGTSALHIALQLAGVKNGDEVITQPLTFIATVNAISYCNATPVFVDVDKSTMGMSPESLEYFLKKSTKYDRKAKKLINKKTLKPVSAVVPMHTYGNPCDIDGIITVADTYSIPVIEDAAESLGSRSRGRHTGTIGKIGILSFNGNKIITTGGGGMILTNEKSIAERAKHITTQAKVPHSWDFYHDMIGYNYRMPNINAALGVAQIELLEELLRNKRHTAELYRSFFNRNNIKFLDETPGCHSNFWLNTIILDTIQQRDRFLQETNSNGIMTRPAWTLATNLPMYSGCQKDELPNAINLERTLVNIPSGYRK
jgi:aminotransferase in exopolysaccharide biosynthesis